MKIINWILPVLALTTVNNINQVEAPGISCERMYEIWSDRCRELPATDMSMKALCWSTAMAAYAACRAGQTFGGGLFGFRV